MKVYIIQGTVKEIKPTQTFDSGFKKREIIITTDEQYPQDVKFDFLKDNVDILDKFKSGQYVKVGFEIRGNEFNGKFYVNLNGVAIGEVEKEVPEVGAPQVEEFDDLEDDLMF